MSNSSPEAKTQSSLNSEFYHAGNNIWIVVETLSSLVLNPVLLSTIITHPTQGQITVKQKYSSKKTPNRW